MSTARQSWPVRVLTGGAGHGPTRKQRRAFSHIDDAAGRGLVLRSGVMLAGPRKGLIRGQSGFSRERRPVVAVSRRQTPDVHLASVRGLCIATPMNWRAAITWNLAA